MREFGRAAPAASSGRAGSRPSHPLELCVQASHALAGDTRRCGRAGVLGIERPRDLLGGAAATALAHCRGQPTPIIVGLRGPAEPPHRRPNAVDTSAPNSARPQPARERGGSAPTRRGASADEREHVFAPCERPPPEHGHEQPLRPKPEPGKRRQDRDDGEHDAEQEREQELGYDRGEQLRRPAREQPPAALAEGGRKHGGGREQEVEQAEQRRREEACGDEPEHQEHPGDAGGDQEQASDAGPGPAVRAELGSRGHRAVAGGGVARATHHAQQRAGVIDRVARRPVGGQREKYGAVRARFAQQLGAVHEAADARRARSAGARVAACGLAPRRGELFARDPQRGGVKFGIEARGVATPAHVAELEVAPRHFDGGCEDVAHARRERVARASRRSAGDGGECSETRLVGPPPDRANRARRIERYPHPGGDHCEQQERLAERLRYAAADQPVVGRKD